MTKGGELRSVVQQQTNMTVGRILYMSAHLLASSERAARLADFSQLVDLYAGLQGVESRGCSAISTGRIRS